MSKLSPERWQEISPYLDQALALTEQERAIWFESLRAEKPELAATLNDLVEEHGALAQEHFLDRGPAQPASEAFVPGRTIGAYRLILPIGQGGMGSVWLAERSDGRFERRVAIKFLNFALVAHGGAERFKREGSILARLRDPHIAELIDAGVTSNGEPYLVLEHVEGEHIDEYCDRRALDVDARIKLFLDVLGAVDHAHAHLIVHRDIKPSNVLVRSDGQVKLLDFGIAKLLTDDATPALSTVLTAEGGGALTPQFAAPEQIAGGAITTATDVYALGVLLYMLLTGRHPAGPGPYSAADLVKAVLEIEPRRASDAIESGEAKTITAKRSTALDKLRRHLRGDLDTIIAKALKKNPAERYGSVTAFADDLHRYLRYQPITARPDSASYRLQKYVRRHWAGITAAAVLVLLLVSFAVVQAVQLRRITRERNRANRIADFMTGIFKVSDPNETVGNTVTARDVLDKAANDIDTGLSKDPELQSQMMRVMGRAYLNLGFFARAQALLQRSLQLGGATGDVRDRNTLNAMHDLAWALLQQGQLAEAEKLERSLVEMQRRALGSGHPDTLATMGELAFTLCQKGKCAEGVELNREVLEKEKRMLGPDARDTLKTINNLSIMLAESGQPEQALALGKDSLERHVRIFGPDNIGTINAMINLGEFQRDAGHNDDAINTLRRALEIETRVFQPDQMETAYTRYALASVLVRTTQLDEALLLLSEAIDRLPPRIALGLGDDPLFASQRRDSRFEALVVHAKLQAARQKRD